MSAGRARIRMGVLGLGRLGNVYASNLAWQIPQVELVAVCDTRAATLAKVADEADVPLRFTDPRALIEAPEVEAVVIVTPTDTHRELVEVVAASRKPVFCEKPLSTVLDDALAMKRSVDAAGIFFQMGFMRRFDRGYAAAQRRIETGDIGRPVVFKSTSRDPFLPSLDYLNTSGGIFVDMGIHDFDLALWLFGTIESVAASGGVLAYPELSSIGDVDNAIASLRFADGRLGVVDLSRNGVYGYDIATEILGTEGALRVGYLRETALLELTPNRVVHDTVPYFMERFARAYTDQLRNFAENLLADRPPRITIDDGVEALRVATAATTSLALGKSVRVDEAEASP